MNTETLKTFVLLSELKNYTHTANKMFIAQSTVTNRIQDLENELNKPLFIRDKKQLRLTEDGVLFLSYAKRILDLEDCAMEELTNRNRFETMIRIGATNTIYDCHLAKCFVKFMESNPNTKLNITIAHSLPLTQMLTDHVIDLAFTYVPYNKNHVKCHDFMKDSLILVTSSKNTTYKKGILQKQLATIPCYYCDFPFQDLGSYIKELFPAGHSFPLEVDRSVNLIRFLLAGTGYSFLPKSMVSSYIEDGTLHEIPLLDFTIPDITCYLLHLSSYTIDPALTACLPNSILPQS